MSKHKIGIFLCTLLFLGLASFPVSNSMAAIEPLADTVSPVPTVEYNLPYAGILPDHTLYFLKVVRDKILLLLTQDLAKKSQLNLLLSDKHLVMGQLLWEKGSIDLSLNTLAKGEKYLLESAVIKVKLKNKNSLFVGEAETVNSASKKHEEIINKLISVAPNETVKQRLLEIVNITHQAIQQGSLLK